MNQLGTDELEHLFINKLQQKYKLNERDLKKAFSRFDNNNNGLLDLEELTKGNEDSYCYYCYYYYLVIKLSFIIITLRMISI